MNHSNPILVNIGKQIRKPNSIDQGDIIFSSVKEYEGERISPGFSIKTVFSGKESYKINGNRFDVKANEFLLVNKDSNIDLTIDGKEITKGICLYPPEELFTQIFTYYSISESNLLEGVLEDKNMTYFTEKKYRFKESKSGEYLSRSLMYLNHIYSNELTIDLEEFYIELLEVLISDQIDLNKQLNRLNSRKKQTKEEIFRRVSCAKNYLEDNYIEKINLDKMAKDVYMSKYHFVRSFKAIYNISPFQYLLKLRLNKAQEYLNKDYSFAEVTNLVGFSDEKNLRKAYSKLLT